MTLLLLSLLPAIALGASPDLPDIDAEAGRDLTALHRILNSAASEIDPASHDDERAAFDLFHSSLKRALEANPEMLGEINRKPGKWAKDVRNLMLRGYLARVYGKQVRKDLGALLQIDTSGPNQEPLATWLEARAKAFGLGFKRLGKVGWEINVGKGKAAVAAIAHVGSLPEPSEGWQHGPHSGKEANLKIWGRGAMGGKASLVSLLYAMRTIRASRIPLRGQIRLIALAGAGREHLIALPGALKSSRLPRHTFVADARFGIGRGERGVAQATLRSPVTKNPDAATEGWRLVDVSVEGKPGRLPESVRAILDPRGLRTRQAMGAARRNLTLMRGEDSGVQGTVAEDGTYISVTFRGDPNDPAEALGKRNAITDLAKYLADFLGVFPDHRGRLIRFLAHRADGKGAGLGVAHDHEVMGSTQVHVVGLRKREGAMEADLDIRWSPGLTLGDVKARLKASGRTFSKAETGSLSWQVRGSNATLVDEDHPLIQSLGKAYADAMRRPAANYTLSRPTLARHIKGAVAFGPAPANSPDEWVRDEAIPIEELEEANRIYLTALLVLAGRR